MSAPPGTAPTRAASPERHRVGRKKPPAPGLTQAKRDAVARMFMAEFPGMKGGEAVRRARDWLTEPDRCIENIRRDGLKVDRPFLARLMEELPLGLARTKKAARPGGDYRPRDEDGHLLAGTT